MTAFHSAFYGGRVAHCRLRPRRHELVYSVFWLLLDLDEIDRVAATCGLLSRNRFNLFGFYDTDHGDGGARPLRTQVEAHLQAAGVECDGGSIRLLAMPRVLGFVFNPLSVYFCYRRDEGLAAIIYEVRNTFGERHTYIIPVADAHARTIRQECPKRFYVSPFMGMALDYVFRVVPPAERVVVSISGKDADGPIIGAVLSAERDDLRDGVLARAAVAYPLLTLKVVAGIYWEALRMWLKGLRLVDRPKAADHRVTVAPHTPVR